MALGLDGNWRAELLASAWPQKIGEDGVKFLIEPPGDSKDSTLSMVLAAVKDIDLDPDLPRHRQRSDTQARGVERVGALRRPHRVGAALLANDPHLGFPFPGVWYLARLVGPGFDIRGATSPGSPAVVLGHNGIIGWGFRPRISTARTSSSNASIRPIPTATSRPTAPALRDARRDDQGRLGRSDPMRVRETRHGPVIDDFVRRGDNLTPQGHVLALQATALDGAGRYLGRGASAAWARHKTGKSSWPRRAASSRRCRTWSTPTRRETSA